MEAEEIARRKQRISAKQLEIMISHMEEDLDLNMGKLSAVMNKADRKRKWEELAEVLNAEGTALKSTYQWRKCWSDQKMYAKNKAMRLRASDKLPSEVLTPVEERIIRLVGLPSTDDPLPRIVNVCGAECNPHVNIIEDALVIESTPVLQIKEEADSNGSIVEITPPSEESSPTVLPSRSSLPETAINLPEANPSEISAPTKSPGPLLPETAINLPEANPSEISAPTKSPGPSLPEKDQIPFVAINLQQPYNPLGSGFMPIILNPVGPEKSKKPASSNDLSDMNATLKKQVDVFKRIATANEQIAHACMILANKSEERTKELTFQNELIQDINQTLHNALKKQKTNEDDDFF